MRLLLLFLLSCVFAASPSANAVTTPNATLVPKQAPSIATEKIAARRALIAGKLKEPNPIIPLVSGLDARQKDAQAIALAAPEVQKLARAQPGNIALAVEVFGVYPFRDSDITEPTEPCRGQVCYRVEMYGFASNASFIAFIDLGKKKVVDIITISRSQPDIPPALTELAVDIAINAPEVAAALGAKPKASDALMANTKTALNRTRCERSRHLCVAPTFVKGERALWAIVDLTDMRLVGTRWTQVGRVAGAARPERAPTEARLQNEVITEKFCEKETTIERGGWQFNYMLTNSDGLRIADVRYRGTPIFSSVKLVDWHVNYSGKHAFGYSDAVGCPYFSQSAVIAAEPPFVEDISKDGKRIGFALIQNYWSEGWPLPCNYYYSQRTEFYDDGRFRPMVASLGRGCGANGTYRPVTRIAFSQSGNFAEWDGKAWQNWPTERWHLHDDKSAVDANGAGYQLATASHRIGIIPARGQFADGGRGDTPFVYVTRWHANKDEGDSDLPTLGPCCNTNHEQGPETFINSSPESLKDARMVMWYVPVLKNDGRAGNEYCWANSVVINGLVESKAFPCFSGPMFVVRGQS